MRRGPDRQSLMGSAAIHVLAVFLVWYTQLVQPQPMEFTAYQIELVSPPPTEVAEESQPRSAEELVVETPEEPEPESPPPPEPEQEEVQSPPPETPEEPPREEDEPEPDTAEESPAAAEEPEEAEEGGEDIEVRMEGLRRDYPVYYENIIRQMHRCFRWQGAGGLEATVQFYIARDGSVEDLDVVDESGNPAFDIEAMGAVECAGDGRFGPLPDDLGLDRLPVRFNFRPRGGDRDLESPPEPAPEDVDTRREGI